MYIAETGTLSKPFSRQKLLFHQKIVRWQTVKEKKFSYLMVDDVLSCRLESRPDEGMRKMGLQNARQRTFRRYLPNYPGKQSIRLSRLSWISLSAKQLPMEWFLLLRRQVNHAQLD